MPEPAIYLIATDELGMDWAGFGEVLSWSALRQGVTHGHRCDFMCNYYDLANVAVPGLS